MASVARINNYANGTPNGKSRASVKFTKGNKTQIAEAARHLELTQQENETAQAIARATKRSVENAQAAYAEVVNSSEPKPSAFSGGPPRGPGSDPVGELAKRLACINLQLACEAFDEAAGYERLVNSTFHSPNNGLSHEDLDDLRARVNPWLLLADQTQGKAHSHLVDVAVKAAVTFGVLSNEDFEPLDEPIALQVKDWIVTLTPWRTGEGEILGGREDLVASLVRRYNVEVLEAWRS